MTLLADIRNRDPSTNKTQAEWKKKIRFDQSQHRGLSLPSTPPTMQREAHKLANPQQRRQRIIPGPMAAAQLREPGE